MNEKENSDKDYTLSDINTHLEVKAEIKKLISKLTIFIKEMSKNKNKKKRMQIQFHCSCCIHCP